MVVRIVMIFLVLFISAQADLYKKNCIKCHQKLPVSIDKYFYRYLLKYSSEEDVKKAMIDYLIHPTKETTVMPISFISRFGIKKKTVLNLHELEQVIDIYWDTYDVSKRLR